MRIAMSYSEEMQGLWRKYEKAGMPIPATGYEVAAWAIENGLWKPRPQDIISMCASDLTKAFREEYRMDYKTGLRFRAKHAVKIKKDGKQLYLWDDIDTAPREHMVKAFALRRKQIVGDCHQLKIDVDYFNNSRRDSKPIQMVFDFTDDVAEAQQLQKMKLAS
uniref:Uncharacterized protein n=1 Tax=Candidatus Kentrum sp. TC TaxID=2126339 RepID=A0A450Y780_9GAMM|nr:MAG: hypothetical protein BECKTC1821D_GA0114238_100148 [Candidatus Kentron sp. TC]